METNKKKLLLVEMLIQKRIQSLTKGNDLQKVCYGYETCLCILDDLFSVGDNERQVHHRAAPTGLHSWAKVR